MKTIILFISTLFLFSNINSQIYNPVIDSLIAETNIDSLVSYVRILSGEDSVMIGDSLVLIEHRDAWLDNNLPADYIKQKLQNYFLPVVDTLIGPTIRNVIGIQEGIDNPEEIYIICAHYDGVPLHAADDNASGTAAVIEAARILSKMNFTSTIYYALWDEEELGCDGSHIFVHYAKYDSLNIKGVINLDMIGYDSDNDMSMDIRTQMLSNSKSISDTAKLINDEYQLGLLINENSAGQSDHASFWEWGYGAVCLIENMAEDYNPYYHTDNDRIEHFSLPYFYAISQMGLGAIATLAGNPEVNVNYSIEDFTISQEILSFPNPFYEQTRFSFYLPEYSDVNLTMFNSLGKVVDKLSFKNLSPGKNELIYINNNLAPGFYLAQFQSEGFHATVRIIVAAN